MNLSIIYDCLLFLEVSLARIELVTAHRIIWRTCLQENWNDNLLFEKGKEE